MSSASSGSVLLAMSVPSFWHCGRTIRKYSLFTILCCLPAAAMAVWNWGLPALRVMSLSIAACVVAEALCEKIMGRQIEVDDFTAVYAGLIFAFLLPADAPWWLVILGAVICVTLGKMAFGGLGANPVSTPLVGWAVLAVSFPILMDPNAVQLSTDFVDPLVRLKFFGAAGADAIPLLDLIMGKQINGLGAGQVLGLFVGGSFLCATGTVRWQISLGFFLGVAALAAFFHMSDPAHNASAFFHLCTGSVMLGGFFMATEMGTTPLRPLPMFLYGLTGGLLVMIIRKYGVWIDGVPFAILLANMLTPYLDMIRPRPFGGSRS